MWNRAFEFFDNCNKRLNTQPDTRREFAAVSNMYARPWCTLLCVFHYILIILYFWYIQTRGKKEDEGEEGNCVFVWFFVFLFCFGCSSCSRRFVLSSVALEVSGFSFPFRSFVNVISGGIEHGRWRRSNGWYGNRGGFEAFVGESRLQGAEAEGRRRRHEDSRC